MMAKRWLGASVFLLALVSHLNSLGGGFHYDDLHSLVENPHVRDLGALPSAFIDPTAFSGEPTMAMYRPVVVLSYVLTYGLVGYTPWPYLLFNMLVHALVAWVVWLLVAQKTGRLGVSWWAGALFAVHPINAQVVNYISSRSEGLAVLGVLAALYWLGQDQRGRGFFAYALALLSKSVAVVGLPLAMLWSRGSLALRTRWVLIGMTCLYGAIITANQFLTRSLAQDVRAYGVQLYTQAKALVYYFYLIATPVRLSVEHPLRESHALGEGVVVAAGLLVVSLVYMVLRDRQRAASVGGMIFLLGLAIPFVVPLNVLVNEHRVYLSCFGVLYAICASLGVGRPSLKWAAWGVLCVLAVLGWQRNAVWSDEYRLWSDAALKAPDAFRVQSNLGLALYERDELERAHGALAKALQLNPRYARTWSNMGLVEEGLGDYAAAEAAYRQALDLRPDMVGVYANLGRLYLGTGRYAEAIAALEKALLIDPRSVAGRTNLGLAHQRAGRTELAVEAYQGVLAEGGATAELFNNLGLAYQDLGRLDEAEEALERAADMESSEGEGAVNLMMLRLRRAGMERLAIYFEMTQAYPQRPDLWRGLAAEYAARGQWPEAIAACRRVIALDPGDEQALANLNILLQKQRDR